MEENKLSEFLEKFSRNQHTDSEHTHFLNWIRTLPTQRVNQILDRYAEMNSDNKSAAPLTLVSKIENRLNELDQEKVVRLWPKILKIAAACVLLITLSLLLFKKSSLPGHTETISKTEIKAGGNKAILKLADGSEIILDSARLGKLTDEVVKTDIGQVSFQAANQQHHPNAYNFISIPRGGQYAVILPDGTKVWLNSTSSLKFPVVFAAHERLVELTGEAYFEVAKNKSKPFKVQTSTQLLEVLGTHFNVNAYADEPAIATTLMEGSVKLSSLSNGKTQLLKPGQQARLLNDFKVAEVDTDVAIDWKDGEFKFAEDNISTIMRKVSRWYDVDVVYQGKITQEGFVGKVPRAKNIEEVLNALKLTGLIDYKINGKQVTITP